MRLPLPVASGILAFLASGLLLAQSGAQGAPPPVPVRATPVGSAKLAPPKPAGAIPAGTTAATIVGQVVDGSGRGINKAAVRLITNTTVETVLTDAKGNFFFRGIPPSEAVVTAQKFGFFDGGYGKHRANGNPLPFTLGNGQVMSDLRIEMFAAAVITGSVTDDIGEPVVNATVVARRREFVNGEWKYMAVSSDSTDDQGFYRIFGLQPGEYIVSTPSTTYSLPLTMMDRITNALEGTGGLTAVLTSGVPGDNGEAKSRFLESQARTAADGRDLVWATGAMPPDADGREGIYPRQFYPSTDQPILALPISLAPSQVRYAVNFQLPLVPSRSVKGRLVGERDQISNQLVRLIPEGRGIAEGDDTAVTVSESDGTFRFVQVPPGRYTLQAGDKMMARAAFEELNQNEPQGFWGQRDVEVGESDVDVLDITMRRTAQLAGRVDAERAVGTVSQVSLRRTIITLSPAEPGLSDELTIRPYTDDGRFAAMNLIPGRYYVRVTSVPAGWLLKSIRAGKYDAIDYPVEISEELNVSVTLTNRPTGINGSVRDARMVAVSGATLLILPVTPAGGAIWAPNRTRETRTSTNGVFIVSGLPPGEYLMVAIDDAVADGWQDERVMATLRTLATRITLRDGENKTVQLRLSVLKR